MLCLGLSALSAAQARADLQTFTFDARTLSPRPTKVYLAGSFNGWNATGQELTGRDGVYSVTVDLPQGVHFYKFVADGNRWLNDPKSDKELEEADGNGGMNSAVLVGPDARKLPAPQPNAINPLGIVFDPKVDINVVDNRTLRIRCRAQAGDVPSVFVVVQQPGLVKSYSLFKSNTVLGYDEFSNAIQLAPGAEGKHVEVWLSYKDGDAVVDVGTSIRARKTPDDTSKEMAVDVVMTPSFVTPAWAQTAVWYQIFPERFRNGDPANDPHAPGEHLLKWTSNWWDTQPGETPGKENFYTGAGNVWQRRYGGDIQGLREKLPYLRSLGITALYLNPIFEAQSMHKYDTRDYRHVDDNLTIREELPLPGETDDPATWKWSKGDLLFLDFVAEAHRQGFKVVLDGVFNHVGREHPFFQDVVQKGKASKYVDWFEIEAFPDSLPAKEEQFGKPGGLRYKAWDKDSGSLPILRKDAKTGLAPGPRDHINAITQRWLAPNGDSSKGVDGWRLDVANDIPHVFWADWRKLVKAAKPDAYIAGEIWQPAQSWLRGNEFDAVMNYQFAIPAQRFFVNNKEAVTPTAFARDMAKLVGMYPLQASLSMMNLYDSHDTDRLASMFVNPDRPYDGANRIQDTDPTYSPAAPNSEQWQRFKQAAEFQMYFLGAPMIYYGDEAGMWSPDDPSNRMPMVWKDLEPFADPQIKFNDEIFKTYQRAIAIRQAIPALQTGYLRTVKADDATGLLILARDLGDQTAFIFINRSPKPISLAFSFPDENVYDWSNPEVAVINTKGDRPKLELKTGAKYLTDKSTLGLKPWSVTVRAPKPR